jgi:pathogenesis-related protein 1
MAAVNSKSVTLLLLCACNSGNADIDASNNGDGKLAIDASHQVGDGPRADVPGGVGEPSELAGMTLYHNQVRAAVDTTGVPGGPLPSLQWDPNLAAYAAQWAAQCQDTQAPIGLIDHDPNRTNVAGYSYIGENIYASGGGATAMGAVDLWASEKANFTYPSSCPSNNCGHYTQIVWRATTHVGCALHNCPGLTYPNSIVCDYGPGGNFGGQNPY